MYVPNARRVAGSKRPRLDPHPPVPDRAKSYFVQHLVKTAHQHGKKVFVDPTRENKGSFYKGIDLFKPNFDEAVALSGISFDEVRHQPHRVLEIGRNLQKLTSAVLDHRLIYKTRDAKEKALTEIINTEMNRLSKLKLN